MKRKNSGGKAPPSPAHLFSPPSRGQVPTNLAHTLQVALNCHQNGEWQKAQALYQHCLAQQPAHLDARYFLGLLFFQTHRLQEAREQLTQVLAAAPNHTAAWFNLAAVEFELLDYKACAQSYRKGLALDPKADAAWLNLGVVMKELGEVHEAQRCYLKALEFNANDPQIHFNLGLLLGEGDALAALAHFDQAVSLEPSLTNAWFSRATVLVRMGEWEQALSSLDRAINSGLNSGLNSAIDSANERSPVGADFYLARANVLSHLQRFERSLADYDQALFMDPQYHPAWSNRGVLLSKMGQIERAIESLGRASEIAPDFADAYFNRAHVYLKQGDPYKARLDFDRLLALAPQTPFALGSRLHAKMLCCDWQVWEAELTQLKTALERGEPVVNPFEFSAMVDDPHLQHQAARIWNKTQHLQRQDHHRSLGVDDLQPLNSTTSTTELTLSDSEPKTSQKIRLAYFSSDFRMHAVSQGIAPLLECHDKTQFEVFAFSLTNVSEDPVRARIRRAVDHFVDAHAMSDLELVDLAKSLKIDIAIDLNGYTMGARTSIFAHRLAPIQASYLGYLGGMGAPYMDYLLADDTLIPSDRQGDYDEKIIHLPCYQINDHSREASTKALTRADLGLPETAFVFCSFNQAYKLNPSVFESWMRILRATPGSVLYLVLSGQVARENLSQEAIRLGVEPERIVFGERMSPSDNLARYALCDLFLDAWPYNAGVTGSDALWMGVPVLTCVGQSFPARMGASLLKAMGLPELICKTKSEYEERAHDLATKPEQLATLRQRIQDERGRQPLFDAPRFTHTLERAYREITRRAQQGLEPDHWHH